MALHRREYLSARYPGSYVFRKTFFIRIHSFDIPLVRRRYFRTQFLLITVHFDISVCYNILSEIIA